MLLSASCCCGHVAGPRLTLSLMRWKSSSVMLRPAARDMAIKCSTALVEPPAGRHKHMHRQGTNNRQHKVSEQHYVQYCAASGLRDPLRLVAEQLPVRRCASQCTVAARRTCCHDCDHGVLKGLVGHDVTRLQVGL